MMVKRKLLLFHYDASDDYKIDSNIVGGVLSKKSHSLKRKLPFRNMSFLFIYTHLPEVSQVHLPY